MRARFQGLPRTGQSVSVSADDVGTCPNQYGSSPRKSLKGYWFSFWPSHCHRNAGDENSL